MLACTVERFWVYRSQHSLSATCSFDGHKATFSSQIIQNRAVKNIISIQRTDDVGLNEITVNWYIVHDIILVSET